VVVDAPATGHALGMLRSPQTFGAIARVGPIVRQTDQVRALLADPERSAYVAVSLASEMSVTETLELRDGLARHLERELDAVVVNGLLPRRFSAAEVELIARAAQSPAVSASAGARERARAATVARAAAQAARAVHERSRAQRNQLARLRRQGLATVTVPHLFRARMDLAGVEAVAEHLDGRLWR
jgi:anion-transporting  ArsA/GET3 family ATPase